MSFKKSEIIRVVIDFIKNQNFSQIKADMPGYNRPEKLVWKKSGKGYVPDITANKNGMFLLFTVKDPNENVNTHLDKWRLFSSYSQKVNRECYIVSLTNQEFTIKNILSENKISANVLTVGF